MLSANPPLRDGPALVAKGRADINAASERLDDFILYRGPFGRKGQTVSRETVDAARKKNPVLVKAGEIVGVLKPESEARKKGNIEILFGRGIYLIVGTIFLIIGLVMLSRPVRQGITEGVKDALAE